MKKQMDPPVCYWSETHHEVKVIYLTSVMFGYSKVDDVVKEMLDILDKLTIPVKLTVSWNEWPLCQQVNHGEVESSPKRKRISAICKMPPKLLHVCHNSIQKGLTKYGYNAEELCLNLCYFFKRSSCRRIEESLGLDELLVLHHVQNHWLSLLFALQYVVAIKVLQEAGIGGISNRMMKAL